MCLPVTCSTNPEQTAVVPAAHLCVQGTLSHEDKSARMKDSSHSAQACKRETRDEGTLAAKVASLVFTQDVAQRARWKGNGFS